eukprot:INCI17410.1.p1 GENE.INCI17410.1~~INCI17410.1.p1  ORF type:complete len:346 (-),score=64.36 INCI17410.1:291-1328(-)
MADVASSQPAADKVTTDTSEVPQLPQPVDTGDDSAAAVVAQWRCWCSRRNSVASNECAGCTTPRVAQSLLNLSAAAKDESKGESAEDSKQPDEETEALASAHTMALVVRSDLGFGAGKIAEQCCLATLSAVWRISQSQSSNSKEHQASQTGPMAEWLAGGAVKTVLSCEDDVAFTKLEARAAVCGIPSVCIHENTKRTVLVLGPAPNDELELVVGQLSPLDWQALEPVEGQGMDAEDLPEKLGMALSLLERVVTAEPEAELKKLKPNAKCHCGSSKKYKKCCASKDLAQKEVHAELNKTMTSVLGKMAGPPAPVSQAEKNRNNRGARVLAFRKQGEYGARKYIKP